MTMKMCTKRRLGLVVIQACLLACNGALLAMATTQEESFAPGDLAGWEDKSFRGATEYALVTDEGRQALKAHSVKAASAKIRTITINAKETPILRWWWKVERSLPGEDVTKKQGDDFAARVYVVFPQAFFWQMRAINYVWAARMPKGDVVPSPYTDHNQLVAVESGDAKAGQWLAEERNIYDDYRHIFHEEPPTVGAIAVMTDTDDTDDEVSAWYGDVSLARH